MTVPLNPGPAGQWVPLEPRLKGLQSVTVSLSQAPTSNARWRLRLFAMLAQTQVQLGELVSLNPTSGTRPTRAVVTGWLPGAESWSVLASLESGTPSQVEQLELTGGTCCAGSAFAVLEGAPVAPFLPFNYFTLEETGPGAIVVPAGFGVVGITVWTTGAGATLQVGANPAIALPPAGALTLAPPIVDGVPTLRGPVTITGAGAIGALAVEVIQR